MSTHETSPPDTSGSEESDPAPPHEATVPHPVRLPGFTAGTEVGLGDVVHRMTSALRIPTCGGCARRAAALNQRVRFTGRNNT